MDMNEKTPRKILIVWLKGYQNEEYIQPRTIVKMAHKFPWQEAVLSSNQLSARRPIVAFFATVPS